MVLGSESTKAGVGTQHSPRIDGFGVVRNGIRGGYPFVESIRSVLHLCDQVFVSDGGSDDGTFEALELLQEHTPRLHVLRDPWQASTHFAVGGGGPIREALNRLRDKLTAPYLFQFDANEVLPIEAAPLLRALPALHPRRELFALPYHQFLGRYWFHEEFRFRLVLNRPTIRVLWDGWTMGFRLEPIHLIHPRELRRLASRAALELLRDRVAVDLPEMYVHLPRPIFRYYGLFPDSFLQKMETKISLQQNPAYTAVTAAHPEMSKILDHYRRERDYDAFWHAVWEHQRMAQEGGALLNKEFPYARYVSDEGHPESIRSLFGQDRYEPLRSMGTIPRSPQPPTA